MTYEEAKAQLMKDFGWTADYAEHALAFFMANADYTDPDVFYGAFHQPMWRDDLAAWNPRPSTQGGITLVADTIEQRVTALEQRDALLTQAVHRILTGEYTGASGAAADVVALQGGTDDLTGKVKVPVFPH